MVFMSWSLKSSRASDSRKPAVISTSWSWFKNIPGGGKISSECSWGCLTWSEVPGPDPGESELKRCFLDAIDSEAWGSEPRFWIFSWRALRRFRLPILEVDNEGCEKDARSNVMSCRYFVSRCRDKQSCAMLTMFERLSEDCTGYSKNSWYFASSVAVALRVPVASVMTKFYLDKHKWMRESRLKMRDVQQK